MHIIYKQDFCNTKESFLGYLVLVMDDLDHTAFIEEWKKYIDAAAYEKNLYKDVKLPSIKKKIDRNDKTEYWPNIIKESLHWLLFYISWSSLQTG